jgi:hypothetical protein
LPAASSHDNDCLKGSKDFFQALELCGGCASQDWENPVEMSPVFGRGLWKNQNESIKSREAFAYKIDQVLHKMDKVGILKI